MSTTIEKALKSEDSEEIKKGRASAKRKFTTGINSLKKLHEKAGVTGFDLNTVKNGVKTEYIELKKYYGLVSELHDKYVDFRKEDTDQTKEADQVKKDEEYIMTIKEEFFDITAEMEKFEAKLVLPVRQEQFTEAHQSYMATKILAQKVSISTEPDELRTALILKERLVKDFDNLKKKIKAFDECKGPEEEAKPGGLDMSKETIEVSDVIHGLDKIILKDAEEKADKESTLLNSTQASASENSGAGYIKLKKIDCPRFSGVVREFAKFKKEFTSIVAVSGRPDTEIGINLKNAIPKKHQHLIDNVDTENHAEMMKILTDKFGQSHLVIDSVVNEIEKMKVVTSDKQFLEFVETLEKIQKDLEALNLKGEISNSTVIGKIEQKLPSIVQRDWTKKVVVEELENKGSDEKFEELMIFLEITKKQVEYVANESRQGSGVLSRSQTNFVTGTVVNVKPEGHQNSGTVKGKRRFLPCLICNSDGATDPAVTQHPMSTCAVWNALTLKQKEQKVKCKKCPFSTNHTLATCTVKDRFCRNCSAKDHHFLLCPSKKSNSNLCSTKSMIGDGSMLPPVMVQTSYVSAKCGTRLGTMFDLCSTDDYITHKCARRNGFEGIDVVLIIEGIAGSEVKIETKLYTVHLVDNEGEVHELPCYGLEKISSVVNPPEKKSYMNLCRKFGVTVREMRRPEEIDILISMRQNHVHPTPIETFGGMKLYKGVFGLVFGGSDPDLKFSPHQLFYPSSAHLAMSTPLQQVQAHTMKSIVKQASMVSVTKTSRDFLDYFKEESIGVECNPRCGGCLCGKCPLGAKQMSLRDERKYERFKSCMEYDVEGTKEDPGPYWRVSYPWDVDRHSLPDNKPAVLGVMNSTARKLEKDPQWLEIYEAQLKTLIEKNFAREVFKDEIDNWVKNGGKVYYIAHQMALNPSSKSTPVRVVYNSSQKYKGYSLNSSWDLGPDIMSNMHGVLLRFREDKVAGQGDITKMYYMLRITKEEEMMQLFVWRFSGEKEIRTFCMTRLVMGNKPSANYSIIGVKETALLDDFPKRFPVGHQALTDDAYVDNVFLNAPDHKTLREGITEVEYIAKHGGFFFKEWIVSGQDVPEQIVGVKLPDAIDPDEERALGVGWDVAKDDFYIITEDAAIFDVKKKKGQSKATMAVGHGVKGVPPEDGPVATPTSWLSESSSGAFPVATPTSLLSGSSSGAFPVAKHQAVKPDTELIQVKPHLTLRICLSKHAKAFDPLGWVLPTKMIGNLLFRRTLQLMKQEFQGQTWKIPWDYVIPHDFYGKWMEYFEMLAALKEVRFPRSIKPDNVKPNTLPILVTFNDGNPESFGAVAYVLWELDDGKREARLLMSKAKLGPLSHKGETVKNELSGATYASRLKVWLQEHSRLQFAEHIPFLDSQIVQMMILKDSYGFNTFAGLRVAEIQQKTDQAAWLHIPGDENISDILTRGATPDKLSRDSVWQKGPPWLVRDRTEWPVTAKIQTAHMEDEMSPFKKKIVSTGHVQTFLSGIREIQTTVKVEMDKFGWDGLILRCGDLPKLIRSTAHAMRLVGRTPKHRLMVEKSGLQSNKEITASEYDDAWIFLIWWEQTQRLIKKDCVRLVPKQIDVKLANYKLSYPHVILGGRVKNFPVSFTGNSEIPIIPYGVLAKLIVLHYHDKYHVDIDTIVAHVRRDVWVIKVRRIAAAIDSRCRICLEKRKRIASQSMGYLPDSRVQPLQPAFSAVCMDLFGPLIIKDDCVKKGPRVHKKVYGVLYTCLATRAVHLDVAIDYDTEAVLHTVRRLLALRGDTRLIISDPGSQLVSASSELSKWRKGWDMDQLVRFGAKRGLEWRTVMADSQHQNGPAESMVKVVKGIKKALMHVMGETIVSLNEMFTLLFECGNLANERPIGLKPNRRTDSEFLSPNSLLMGRTSTRISSGPFQEQSLSSDDPKAAKTRFRFVQTLVNQFWKVWMKLYFPSLLVRQKWHTQKRNMKVGDVCLLEDSNEMRGEWRLARVNEVYPDSSGVVRNVEVCVKPKPDGKLPYRSRKPNYLKRHVSKLIVIEPAEMMLDDVDEKLGEEGKVKEDDIDLITVESEADDETRSIGGTRAEEGGIQMST